ncbi:MAG TPA: hypothetical protein VG013_16765, partial [Gemmataceae bacterium]|nr:hypothetical protein [Gemmataceae bacterium]
LVGFGPAWPVPVGSCRLEQAVESGKIHRRRGPPLPASGGGVCEEAHRGLRYEGRGSAPPRHAGQAAFWRTTR